jgi:adenylate kinase family enzyme
MDNKDIEENEENIRMPDEVKVERLMNDYHHEMDDDIENAISISLQEYTQHEQNIQQYEAAYLHDYYMEIKKRKDTFTNLLMSINKTKNWDKEIHEIYLIINPIIESYCNQYINTCNMNEKIYDKIFTGLKQIRIDATSLDALKAIIQKNESTMIDENFKNGFTI